MNDRFNFRFGVTISHYDENDEDIETTIICETEAIYDDGTVGICKDTLENVVNALKLGDEKERTLWNALYEYERCDEWFILDPDFIEQCTGLNDNNGRLIFENDYIENDNTKDDVYLVVFDEKTARFMAKEMNGNLRLINKNVRVVGNIHEKESK